MPRRKSAIEISIDQAKTCVHLEKTVDFGEEGAGKTRYLCQIHAQERPDHDTATVWVSRTCVKCPHWENPAGRTMKDLEMIARGIPPFKEPLLTAFMGAV
jgi:hypothetical protein